MLTDKELSQMMSETADVRKNPLRWPQGQAEGH